MTVEPIPALRPLTPLIGTWTVEASFPGAEPTGPAGRTEFDWAVGGTYLVQRTHIDIPHAPDSMCIVSNDLARGCYRQHYFDSRGVVRVYEMRFLDGEWTLLREEHDFSPLDFSQRFTGRLSDDGNTIEGEWEIAHDRATYEHDFFLTYKRII